MSDLMSFIKTKDSGENEFQQAVENVIESVKPLIDRSPEYRREAILKRITEPEKVFMFGVPWVDDQGQVQVNLIVTGLGATTFEDVFSTFTRQEREIPAPIQRKVVNTEVDGEEELAERFDMGRDPLDVPAFMRRRAYADISFGE